MGPAGQAEKRGELAARWGATLPGEGRDRGGGNGQNSYETGYGNIQAGRADGRRRGNESSGMDQFLAQPALVNGIQLQGSPVIAAALDFRCRWLERLVDMGLERQALQEKGQQSQDSDPPSG